MGVLIEGVEIPTGHGALTLKIWPDGQVEIIDADGNWETSYAVPVPPNVRLVDADALKKLFGMGSDCHTCQHGDSHGQCGFGPLFSDMCEALDNAPVIIEEERSDV